MRQKAITVHSYFSSIPRSIFALDLKTGNSLALARLWMPKKWQKINDEKYFSRALGGEEEENNLSTSTDNSSPSGFDDLDLDLTFSSSLSTAISSPRPVLYINLLFSLAHTHVTGSLERYKTARTQPIALSFASRGRNLRRLRMIFSVQSTC